MGQSLVPGQGAGRVTLKSLSSGLLDPPPCQGRLAMFPTPHSVDFTIEAHWEVGSPELACACLIGIGELTICAPISLSNAATPDNLLTFPKRKRSQMGGWRLWVLGLRGDCWLLSSAHQPTGGGSFCYWKFST